MTITGPYPDQTTQREGERGDPSYRETASERRNREALLARLQREQQQRENA